MLRALELPCCSNESIIDARVPINDCMVTRWTRDSIPRNMFRRGPRRDDAHHGNKGRHRPQPAHAEDESPAPTAPSLSTFSYDEAFNPTINADALTIADDLDSRIASGNTTASLFCIPVLLKDNDDAVGMKTTGGCMAMAGSKPLQDAPTITALRRAGALILGKTNLHEMALEGISNSPLRGQTVNTYDQARTPVGSIGGAGAAIAANFAVLRTGGTQTTIGGEKH
jgi:hypothetical protein